MEPTTILSNEHRVIEIMLDCIDRIARRARKDHKLDGSDAEDVIDFIRNFADRCHHGKEEDHLFRTLTEKGMPTEEGPIGAMLSEHEQGRALVRGMAENIENGTKGDRRALEQFAEHSENYVALLRAHIRKEDGVLFPMAERFLTVEERQELTETFGRVEHEDMGEGTHERYIELVKALAHKYDISTDNMPQHACGCGH